MRFQRASNAQTLALDSSQLLGAGGEARIYTLPDQPDLVAKIWHKPTPERARKLRVMVANPPTDPMAAQHHSAIAWPLDLLHLPGRPQLLAGFLMPRVIGMRPLAEFCNPKTRRERCPLFNYRYLHRTARNLAIALRALHERGYVVGDLNESNVLVAETALVTLVDTDSFQVWDAEAGIMYRCRVGKPEFTAPELQGRSFASVDRAPVHDLFGLGVLLFELLMEGTHPFAGVYHGRGEPPSTEERIAKGHFVYGTDPHLPYRRKPTAPPFEVLVPGLRDLFVRCFQDGHFRPALRPEAQSWQWLLEDAEAHLLTCWANDQHLHGDHLEQCPWCQRTQLLGGRDPFPSQEAVRKGEHLRPSKPRRHPRKPAQAKDPSPPSGLQPLPVPTPPPVPSSRTLAGKRKSRPLLGDWNDLAWVAAALASLAVLVSTRFQWKTNPLSLPLAAFGLLTGILAEAKAHRPDLDGQGKWLARVSIAVSLGVLLACVFAL